MQALGNKNILLEEKTNNSKALAEQKVEDKDHSEGLKEGDDIFKILLDMHEDVPLGDPGPSNDGEERVGGATQ